MNTRPQLVDLDALLNSEEAAMKREYVRAIALNAVLKTIQIRNRQLFTIQDAGLANAIFTLLIDVREVGADEQADAEIASAAQPRATKLQTVVATAIEMLATGSPIVKRSSEVDAGRAEEA